MKLITHNTRNEPSNIRRDGLNPGHDLCTIIIHIYPNMLALHKNSATLPYVLLYFFKKSSLYSSKLSFKIAVRIFLTRFTTKYKL